MAAVMRELPSAAREYIGNEQYSPLIKQLVTKYRLESYQEDLLTVNVLFLLLNIRSVNEVSADLAERAQLDQGTLSALTQDIQTRIFAPFLNQVRAGVEKKETPVQKSAPQRPPERVVPPVQVPTPSYSAPPLQSPRYVRVDEDSVVTKAAPLPPKVAMPARPTKTLAPIAASPIPPHVTQQQSVQALPAHENRATPQKALPPAEEPAMPPPPVRPVPEPVVTPTPSDPTTPPVPARDSVPVTPEPKLRLADPVVQAPPAKTLVTPPVPVRPPNAEDPYREPIEP